MKQYMDKSTTFLIVIVLLIIVGCYNYQKESHTNTIINGIKSHGYELVNIDSKVLDYGPFRWWEKGKYNHVYEVTYLDRGVQKTVWFRTGWNDLWRNSDGSEFK